MTAPTIGIASITADANLATVAWLNAFLATSQDEVRTALFRTLSVEFFRDGVQFIACDGTMLFRTWVHGANAINPVWPSADERPDVQVLVMDAEKFAFSFMNTLRAATSEFTAELTITVDQHESDQPSLSDDLTPNVLTLSALGQHLHCRLLDQPFPDWRSLRYGVDRSELVDGLCLARRLFATVGKLRGVNGVDLEFHGETKSIEFVAMGTSEVRGMLMPMRRTAKANVEDEDEK